MIKREKQLARMKNAAVLCTFDAQYLVRKYMTSRVLMSSSALVIFRGLGIEGEATYGPITPIRPGD